MSHTCIHTHTTTAPLTTPPPQPTVKLFIDGKFVESKTNEWINNYNPVSMEYTAIYCDIL